jgi:catechol 2,3-dioxygenase-like lactoylglutathione lyase family enzyme
MAMSAARVDAIAYLGRNVSDLARSVSFYCERLGFTPCGPVSGMDPALGRLLGFSEGVASAQRLRLGAQHIELVEAGARALPYPANRTSADLRFQHFAVRCPDMKGAFARLMRTDAASALPAAISRDASGTLRPVRLPARNGGAVAFKFRDPDGHPVELIALSGDAPDPWAGGGIDHSAISVSDAAASIAFYSCVLGFSLAARQTNSGSAQDALDALQGAVVDVIALQTMPATKPHLELLGYRHPVEDNDTASVCATDIASDRLVMRVTGLRQALAAAHVSSPVATLASGESAALLRDPDGHLLLLVE